MTEPAIQLLTGPEDLDLKAHGVIEAHAGTGKTHTIVQLVLRLLKGDSCRGREAVHISNLLLVTYTDKAAGELRERIREGLRRELDAKPDPHLSDCLACMHEAMLGTIHSVCLRILRTWPFDTGVQFQTTQAEDELGLEQCFLQMLRQDWQRPGSAEAEVLALLLSRGVEIEKKHRSTVLAMAGKLLDTSQARLDSEALLGMTDCREFLKNKDSLAQRLEAEGEAALNSWLQGYRSLAERILALPGIGKEHAARLQEKLRRLENALAGKDFHGPELAKPVHLEGKVIFTRALNFFKSNSVLLEEFLTGMPDSLGKVRAALVRAEDLRQNPQNPALAAFLCGAAAMVALRWQEVKARQGMVSFIDMLRLTHEAVRKNPSLVRQLRGRLRYGIIDEFQDTSVLQWRIFRRIFLDDSDSHDSRLFLVGDPKQSIYAFQGADVGSYAEARDEVVSKGGKLYGLVRNFRSLPGVIEACNAVLAKDGGAEDWFLHDRISYPGKGPGGRVAEAPERPAPPSTGGTKIPSMQVIPVWGKAGKRLRMLAEKISLAIRQMAGTTVAVPNGLGWKTITLEYSHFAILVEKHTLAGPFLDRLAEEGVPAVKYKLEGVFQSESCLAVRAMLCAVDPVSSDVSKRLAALFTPFFEQHPADLDPSAVLEPLSPPMKLFVRLEELARRRCWGQFFEHLLEGTAVETRLARLGDGERRLADLRQVLDHCLECLVLRNWSIGDLTEHLGRLLKEEESLPEDRNLHTLATARSAVRVLTMHAAKGLEFPVVFVVPGSGRDVLHAPAMRSWNNPGGVLSVAPQLREWKLAKEPWTSENHQERRRRLYVALTRPQCSLFAPLMLETEPPKKEGAVHWDAAELCNVHKGGDSDLGPRLLSLLRSGRLNAFDCSAMGGAGRMMAPEDSLLDHLEPGWFAASDPDFIARASELDRAVKALELPKLRSLQTSYTELSHGLEHDRVLGASEEFIEPGEYLDSALPRGRDTGDALHLVLEACLGGGSWPGPDVAALLRAGLREAGVLRRLPDEKARASALKAAERMVRRGLESCLDLGPWGGASLASLIAEPGRGGCRAELEFQLAHSPDWLHGFMDVVFRIPDSANPRHPWRYFVLDWKTNSLPVYDKEHIEASMRQCGYDLQARVYSHALHCFLQGLLGEAYRADLNLGAAVYVYLRGLEHADEVYVWRHAADPEGDGEFVAGCIAAWKEGQA